MKSRNVTLPDGRIVKVPQNIQRIDCKATHGWQVRYAGSKLISDHGRSPTVSLREAKVELASRVKNEEAPTRLQREPSVNKTTDLPVGISGPIVRRRPGSRVFESNLSVSLPRFGQNPRRSTIYIGNENTYTAARYAAALKKAITMRARAEEQYQRDATKARRAAA